MFMLSCRVPLTSGALALPLLSARRNTERHCNLYVSINQPPLGTSGHRILSHRCLCFPYPKGQMVAGR